MTAYGPNAGVIPFTGFTNTLKVGIANLDGTSGEVQFNGMTQMDGHLSRLFRSRGNRVARELFLTLLGGAVGDAASETYKRRTAAQEMNTAYQGGGVVPIETVSQISRATVTADATNTVAMMSRLTKPATYATDASGNGAGHVAGW